MCPMKASKVIEELQSCPDYDVVVCARYVAIPQMETVVAAGIDRNDANRTFTITVDPSPERVPQEHGEAIVAYGKLLRSIDI